MRPRTGKFNPKRKLLPLDQVEGRRVALLALADRVRYGGNPEHKRNPGDFDLEPPSAMRPGKSLCDDAKVFNRSEALSLLRAGLRAAMVSDRFDGEWPFQVWAVTSDGVALEGQLERPGVYHGYPMPVADPFREEVLKRWARLGASSENGGGNGIANPGSTGRGGGFHE